MNPIIEFLEGHDFERTEWSEIGEAPRHGEATAGYRIMYTYTDPSTGQKTLFSPLVIQRPEITQMEATAMRPYIKEGKDTDMPQFGAQTLGGVHHTDMDAGMGRKGYYYFLNQSTAEDYMAAIIMGTKRVGAKGVGLEAPYEVDYNKGAFFEVMNKRLRNLSIDIYQVTGVAESNPVDEGYTMNDMVYTSQPIKSFSLENIAEFSNRFRGMEQLPPDPQLSKNTLRALQYMIKG